METENPLIGLARSLGWNVRAYDAQVTMDGKPTGEHKRVYILRSPLGVVFNLGQPVKRVLFPVVGEGGTTITTEAVTTVETRLTEDEAWKDLPRNLDSLWVHSLRVDE